MNQKLVAYLNSQGKVIPENYADYTAYGSYHNLCIFCDTPHLKAGVIKVKSKDTLAATVFCCDDCQFEIDATMDVPVSFMKDPRTKTEITIANDAITNYINTGLFPTDVHKFCIGGERSECCVFCGRGFDNRKSSNTLVVPQGPEQTKVITSSLQLCPYCADDYIYLVQRYGEENLHDDSLQSITQDKCILCNTYYPITIEEHDYREENDLLNKCYCNDCLEIHWNKDRHQITNCATCGKQLVVDLVSNINYREWSIVYCPTCKKIEIMIEVPIQNDITPEDSVKLVLTDVQCRGETRWNCVVVYQHPEYNKTTIDKLCTNYHECNKGRDPCGCYASAAEAAYHKTLEVLEYFEKKTVRKVK